MHERTEVRAQDAGRCLDPTGGRVGRGLLRRTERQQSLEGLSCNEDTPERETAQNRRGHACVSQ